MLVPLYYSLNKIDSRQRSVLSNPCYIIWFNLIYFLNCLTDSYIFSRLGLFAISIMNLNILIISCLLLRLLNRIFHFKNNKILGDDRKNYLSKVYFEQEICQKFFFIFFTLKISRLWSLSVPCYIIKNNKQSFIFYVRRYARSSCYAILCVANSMTWKPQPYKRWQKITTKFVFLW